MIRTQQHGNGFPLRIVWSRRSLRAPASLACLLSIAVLCLSSLLAPPSLAAAADGAADGLRFDIWEFRVEGNTLLPTIEVERAVYPFLGPQRSDRDANAAAAALEKAYQARGYRTVLIDIPEQNVESGVIRLSVTEGKVGRVRVTGARYFAQERILAQVPALAPGTVPDFERVQKDITAVNQQPDRRVTPVFRAGTISGTTDVDLTVEDRSPLHGSLTLDNKRSLNTTPLRLSGSLRYENLFQREHSLGLQFQTTPQDTREVKVFSASYTVPLQAWTLTSYAVRTRSNVGTAIGGTQVLGAGNILGVRAIRRLPAEGTAFSHMLSFGADYKDLDENVRVGASAAQAGATDIRTPIQYMPVSVSYNLFQDSKSGRTQASTGLVFALRGLGDGEFDFDQRRFRARPNFFVVKADMQRLQNLPGDFVLLARLEVQGADQPLLSNEQFFIGGADSVRGYFEVESIGDFGGRATVELRGPRISMLPKDTDLRMHGFVDAGAAGSLDRLPGQARPPALNSTGVGLRLRQGNLVSISSDLAWPMRSTANTRAWSPRLLFSAAMQF